MRNVDVAELNAFAEVAARRSFARAAAQLGVSRSRLSETIRGIEERLGVRLLNRTTRSVALTEAGERLLARLRPVLADLSAALDSVNDFRNTPAGLLRLTVPPPVARWMIAPLLAPFLTAHPAIELEISSDGTLTDIVRERFDAGIRFGERIDRDMVALRILHEMRPMLVAAPAYLARRGRPTSPQELQTHNCIRTRFPSGAFAPWRFEKGGKALEVAVGGSLIVNDPELLLQAAIDGVGLAHSLPDLAAAPVADGRLVPLLEDWMPRPVTFFLYYPTRRQVPAALQAFVDFLRKERLLAPASRRSPATAS
jgi:DNA-binding transcriptional LysR family regulator